MIKSILIYCISAGFFFFGLHKMLPAQNAPVTTITTVVNAIPNQQVMIPVTVTDFNNIGSISLSLDYDSSMLHFESGTINPLLGGNYGSGDNDIGNGMHRLITGWYGSGITLPNGSWIINYTFTYLSGTPLLQWFDDGPSCEYTDIAGIPLNDSSLAEHYINGHVYPQSNFPDANAGIDTTIPYGTSVILQASNAGIGSYSYHWSPENLLINPDLQNAQTIHLTSSVTFHLVVTETNNLNQSSDDKVVTVLDSVVNVGPSIQDDAFQLFPNPVKDCFILKAPASSREIKTLKIISSVGLLIKNIDIGNKSSGNEYRIEVDDIPPGLYVLYICSESKLTILKLILL